MTRTPKKSRGLGRGLSALMSDVTSEDTAQATPKRPDMIVPIEQVQPNPDQPRRTFADDALAELSSSQRVAWSSHSRVLVHYHLRLCSP